MQNCGGQAGRRHGRLLALACLSLCVAGAARAEDTSQSWPELNAYWQLNERSRAFFSAAYALGKESDSARSADMAAYLDVSLKPIAPRRRERLSGDWQRNRYLWARIGYVRVFDATDSTGVEVAEDRGVIAFYGRAPLPAQLWLEARTRADFRWIGDEQSNRYRIRLDLSREVTVFDKTVAPYGNVEWFYDTRYDDWTRILATIGAEVTVSSRFRYEVYVARQADSVPEDKDLNALGVVVKWYF